MRSLGPTLLLALLACGPTGADSVDIEGGEETGSETGGETGDTADSGVAEVDADGDGAPSWSTATDPATADCDDADPNVGPDTVRFFPAGRYVRGSDDRMNTSPAREIGLSAYCLDRFEVTNAAFVPYLEARAAAGMPNQTDEGALLYAFVDDTPDIYAERIVEEGGVYSVEAGYEDHPVAEVYWAGADGYCAWKGGRLPTEAEWEAAARGGEQRTYPWGEADPTCTLENFAIVGDTHLTPCVDDTAAVGSYPTGTSAQGLSELGGNIAEWVFDWYRDDYYADSPDQDPQGPESGWVVEEANPEGYEARLTRGGNYLTGPEFTSTFARWFEPSKAHSNGVGFRCAQTPR